MTRYRSARKSAREVSECNTGNNTASETVSARLGEVSLMLSSHTLAPGEQLELDALVTNSGALPAGYQVALHIEGSDGVRVIGFPEQGVSELAAGEAQRVVDQWNTGVTVAGPYRAVAVLYAADGRTLDTDSADLVIREGGDSPVPVADVRVGAERASYRLDETAALESLLENTSASTLIQNARYRLVVSGPDGAVLLNEERPVSSLAVAQVLPFSDTMPLDNTQPGTHSVAGLCLTPTGKRWREIRRRLMWSGTCWLPYPAKSPWRKSGCIRATARPAATVSRYPKAPIRAP